MLHTKVRLRLFLKINDLNLNVFFLIKKKGNKFKTQDSNLQFYDSIVTILVNLNVQIEKIYNKDSNAKEILFETINFLE